MAGSLVQALRAAGHDVAYVAEGPPFVPDESVLDQASREDRLLLTEDHDFGALVVRDNLQVLSVMLAELHGLSTAAKSARIVSVLEAISENSLRGWFTVVEPSRIRQRPLRPGP